MDDHGQRFTKLSATGKRGSRSFKLLQESLFVAVFYIIKQGRFIKPALRTTDTVYSLLQLLFCSSLFNPGHRIW